MLDKNGYGIVDVDLACDDLLADLKTERGHFKILSGECRDRSSLRFTQRRLISCQGFFCTECHVAHEVEISKVLCSKYIMFGELSAAELLVFSAAFASDRISFCP